MIYTILYKKDGVPWTDETTFPTEAAVVAHIIDAQSDPVAIYEHDEANRTLTLIDGRALDSLFSAYHQEDADERAHREDVRAIR